jgi:hypothetical protein
VTGSATDVSECPNCGTALNGHYCPECGQKAAPIAPTFHDLVHDFTHELLHVDGKIFRSVRLLLTRPGFLTRDYFQGRKARHVSPIRLYLIFSVAFFAVSTIALTREPFFAPDEKIEVGALGRALGVEESTPAEANAAMAAQAEWAPRVMFLLVPLSAWLVQLVTRTSGRTYPQHLYFALHVHAGFFAVLTVTTLLDLLNVKSLSNALFFFQLLFLFVYTLIGFRTAYGGRWRLALARTSGVLFIYTVVIFIATLLMTTLIARTA